MATFGKMARTYDDQLSIWESRGLIVNNREFALKCLENLNYYRLSVYRFPLAIQNNHDEFEPGTTFDDLWKLYSFDRTLRRVVLDASKRVEVSVRTKWAYQLGHKYGAFAYEDQSLFHDCCLHTRTLYRLDQDLDRSKEDFVKHFRTNYGRKRPPIWAITEILTFGQLSHFVKNLKKDEDRRALARCYDLDHQVFSSFLHHLAIVRNHAAHHARIWNRKFVVKMIVPKFPHEISPSFSKNPSAQSTIYNTLTMLLYLLKIIEADANLSCFLKKHIASLDQRFYPAMGFPEDWQQRLLWAE